jgi:hypothetical protein
MARKRSAKSGKKRVKDLPARKLSSKSARSVKGGVIAIIAPTEASRTLLPAVQKVRESG